MHPVLIQAALKARGVSQVQIARECDVKTPAAVAHVIQRRSRSKKIEAMISARTGLTLKELWPEWYGPEAGRAEREAGDRLVQTIRAAAG